MNVERVLAELDEKGIHILVKGPNITLGGFQEALEPALLERVIGLKEQIISYLSQKPSEIVGCNLSAQHRPDRLPLSYAQERQWLMHQLGQVDTISASVRLRGRLDRAALEWSFAALLQRHEALRTRFVEIEGAPVQVIDAPNAAAMQVEDVSELAREGGALAVLQRVRVVTQQPFDLKQGPLFRVHLLRLSGDEHIAVVTMHHIVSDGWSVGILIREVGALYTAHIQGQPSPLPELTIQYADYVMWQRGWLQGEVLEKQLAYWKDQLSGAPVALELPTDRPRPPVQSYRGQVVSFELSVGLTAGISALARREGATLFMVLLAAFNVVLSRWSGQLDVVVGSPIAGRSLRELEGLIGHFVNLLPLRTDLSRNPSFRALLGRVKDVALGAYPNQDLPFEKLLEELRPVRDLSRQPIFQVLFALQNMQREALQLPGLELSRLAGKQVTAKLDLSLYMQEREGRLEGHLEYAMDMFERSTIGRLAAHLRVLLEGIVANPDTRIGELPLLPEPERRQLLEEWNETAAEYPKERCIHELFEEQAQKTPDAAAVIFQDQKLTYAELDRRSNQLAHHLRGLGVGPEVIVGLCVERSLDMVVGLLGILRAGGAYLPLDPNYPADRLAYMVSDAKVPVLLTQARLVAQLPKHQAQMVCLDADWNEIERHPATAPLNTTLSDNLAYLIYTSGSTGTPKGVMIEHISAHNLYVWYAKHTNLGCASRNCFISPFSFDLAQKNLLAPLLHGGLIEIAPTTLLSGAELRSLIGAGAAIVNCAPSQVYELGSYVAKTGDAPLLDFLVLGGEAINQDALATWLNGSSKQTRLINSYGPAECSDVVSASTRDTCAAGILTVIGRPISNARLYVLDDALLPVPIGVSGELYIGGIGLARGYLGRPGLTAERFVPSSFGSGERLYRTGDVVRWRADGELEYLGRIDHQVKLRGFRIELGEIEARLLEHPAVRETAVLAREDVPGDKRLVAYVVGADAAAADAGKLRAHLKRTLPDYMVPSAFVQLEALPLTPNRKVDRWALPAPDDDAIPRGAYVAPRTPVEEVLAGIWCEVLKLDRVGLHDNFFELGGHSLLAMRVVARARDTLQFELSLRTLFEVPTIAELSERITEVRFWMEQPPAADVMSDQEEGVI